MPVEIGTMSYVGSQPSSSVPIVTMTIWSPDLRERTGPLYRVIADALAEDRAAGRLAPGARLPTHRELAERLGVTVGTVTRAYAEAEKRGLVRGEVGRGTYVRADGVPAHMPAPMDVGDEASPVELGVNAPATPEGDPASTALRKSLEEVGRSPRLTELLAYQPAAGAPTHREAGAGGGVRGGAARHGSRAGGAREAGGHARHRGAHLPGHQGAGAPLPVEG